MTESLMLPDFAHINSIAASILTENAYLFPSSYPDIPLNVTMLKNALLKAGIEADKTEFRVIMQQVELALASMVPLNWNNYGSIALLLNQQNPQENLLAISEQRIIELTRGLPNFKDESEPDADIIDSVIYTWISLTDAEIDFIENESWS
ncbi:MAG: hypothetical protein M9948_07325 [Lentimicrobium sp.]|nr:hypothetical protein [Lentimicrobium sp.]